MSSDTECEDENAQEEVEHATVITCFPTLVNGVPCAVLHFNEKLDHIVLDYDEAVSTFKIALSVIEDASSGGVSVS